MSTTAEIQIAPLPTAEEIALTLLQALFATNGTPTDYNIGSIIRTYSEAIGSIEEIEGVTVQSQALQAMVYSAYSVFGISPLPAGTAQGIATFQTLSSAPLPAGQSVLIPVNTIVQTQSGVQFGTSASAILASGTSSVNVQIQATVGGANGNVNIGAINQIVTGLSYPLAVTNAAQTSGGSNAETASETLARFLAYVYSLGLCSPIAVASACIGVAYGQEEVQYASCWEPWIDQIIAGSTTPTAGFNVIIDDGTGQASANLIAAVTTYLNTGVGVNTSGQTIGNGIGYRPAGVPFNVYGVNAVTVNGVVVNSAIPCSVIIIANANNASFISTLQTLITNAIDAYFQTLNFADPALITAITATVADVSFGQLTNLSVTLLDGSNNPQTIVPPPILPATTSPITGYQRVVLSGVGVTIN